MKKRVTEYHFDRLAPLLLFSVFAVCVAIVLLVGADAYKGLVRRDGEVHDRRTCMQYVAARVHQAEGPDYIKVETFGSGNALVIADSSGCITRVYYYDGHLMELYTAAGTLLSPESGERVMQTGGLELSLEDGLLTVTTIDMEGEQSTLRLSLCGGEEAGA